MKSSCHSEYGKIESILLKHAEAAWISQKKIDDEWDDLNYLGKPEMTSGVLEYDLFKNIIEENSSSILSLPQNEHLSMDSIYCRDASLATDYGMIICRMGKEARNGEPQAEMDTYISNGIPVLGKIQAPGTLEGGDVAWIDTNTLAVGRTYRTNDSGIEQLNSLLEPNGIHVIQVDLPHFRGPSDVFHLMSIFSPIDKDLAVVYSKLMPVKFREELKNRGYHFVEVPEEEYDTQGCNVLALAPRKVLVIKGNPITKSLLEAAGVEVIEYEGSEISVKGEGGPTCLTRPIKRHV